MKPIPHIVQEYRKQQKLSLRKFAEALSQDQVEISHQSVKNWEDGVNEPQFSFVLSLALTTHDWRSDFAFDLLAVMKPDVYSPVTSIGEKGLSLIEVSA
jgi:transcriptional regulator with XRE-family HTH domain